MDVIVTNITATAMAARREEESSADAADRIAYGILVAALEEGLVRTLRDAVNVLKRFSAPAGMLGEGWLGEQGGKLRERR